MASVLQISDAATLALHATVYLAANEGEPTSTGQMAEAFGASKAHLSKVLQRLSRSGLVKSVRGPKGGFSLAQPADEVTLLQVYESIEGELESVDCLLGEPVCNGRECMLGDLLESLNGQVRERFAGTHLSDLSGTFAGAGSRSSGESDG